MKKALTFFITVFMLAVLCTGCSGPNEQTNEYKIEENTADNKATYPYVVHTDSAIWYLSQDDIDLLGEDVFFEGLRDILQYQDSDFSDARAALSGFIQDKVEPIEIRTDFCGKAGISKTEIVGAYYNSLSNFIKVFRDWKATKDSLLHEYVHYLTIHCTQTPAKHGLFTEGIADYISMMVCHNRIMDSIDMEKVYGESFADIYKHWKKWNTEYFSKAGLTLLD